MSVSACNSIYNARIRENPNRRCRSPKLCLLSLIALYGIARAAGQWQPAAEQLAKKIVAVTDSASVAVTVDNRSALSAVDSNEVRRQLLAELGALGVHFAATDRADAVVRVTLSENQQSYVWIAEIDRGSDKPTAVMISVPHATDAARDRASITIEKAHLWSDTDQILDVAFLSMNPPHMAVLQPERVVSYVQENAQWRPEQSLPIASTRPWPRDLRGRMIVRKDHWFDAYLPGIFCRSSSNLPLTVNCQPSDDPWPLTPEPSNLSAFFSPSRNFFTGVLSPGIQKQTAVAPFYSAAPVLNGNHVLWALATIDGQVHLVDGVTDQTTAIVDWGSDITFVKSKCGSGWQILATSNHDEETDGVTAFEFADREPITISQPVKFNGRITALWTDADGNGAVAVIQDYESRFYEAYRLTIACQ